MSAINGQSSYPTLGKIIKYDNALDKLIAPDAKIEVLASGYIWTEGPVWVKNGNYLLFSDVPANTIFKWKENEGVNIFLTPSGYTGTGIYSNEPGSNGLIINQKGELVACEHGDRRVSAMPLSNGGKRTLADNFQGKKFNSPNDVTLDNRGNLFLTDPPYGLVKQEKDSSKETPYQGVYEITPDGKVTLLVDTLTRPNGIALSPDGQFLFIANSDSAKARWYKYKLGDQSVVSGEVFNDARTLPKSQIGGPDGMKIDKTGTVFATGPGGVLIFNSKGKLLGRINLAQSTANVALNENQKTLYITSDSLVLRLKMR